MPGRDSARAVLIVARDGTPLRAFPDRNHIWRHPVRLDEVSPLYLQALVGYEDRYFRWHPGVNPVALVRAAGQWASNGHIVSGGSTLTMQVARVLEPTPRTVAGKLRQLLRALQLEARLSKDEILGLYINYAPMGGVLEGVEAASRAYLGKPARRLSHAEAALLVVLPQAPSLLRPDRHATEARAARDKVLRRMDGRWSPNDIADALQEPAYAQTLRPPLLAPLLAERLKRLAAGQARIDTFIDAQAQQNVELLMADRLGAVTSIDAFVPTQQAAKLEIIADIRTRLDAKRSAMSEATRADIDAWYDKLSIAEPIDIEHLPRWVQQQFEDTDGEVGRFVIAWTRGSKADYLNSRRIYDAFAVLETPAGEVPVAAEFFVLPEVFEAIEHDGPRVLVLATVAMLLTTVLAFRGLGGPAVVTMVVGTSLLWVVALMLLLGWKLNFFNVIVLPLLIGMAQDDALHIYERWKEAGPGQLRMVLRETGGAVFLTSETTVCGFAGILFANHRGLQSMAWIAVAGMTLALIAAVALLPSLLWVVDRITLARLAREAAAPKHEG